MCVFVCVCVGQREGGRERKGVFHGDAQRRGHASALEEVVMLRPQLHSCLTGSVVYAIWRCKQMQWHSE